jgi:hypothetical protein
MTEKVSMAIKNKIRKDRKRQDMQDDSFTYILIIMPIMPLAIFAYPVHFLG